MHPSAVIDALVESVFATAEALEVGTTTFERTAVSALKLLEQIRSGDALIKEFFQE